MTAKVPIVFIGDTHAADGVLAALVAAAPADSVVIHVGDIGLWPQLATRYVQVPRPIYFIEGNHDHLPSVAHLTKPTPIWPNLIYVPRGTVLELAGRRIGFLGGATSVDRKWRPHGGIAWHAWFDEEEVTADDAQRLLDNASPPLSSAKGLDLLVTHCPPASVINRNFERPGFLRAFELPADWTDPSALMVEWVWRQLHNPPLVCGHMHRSVRDGNVCILDVNEVLIYND